MELLIGPVLPMNRLMKELLPALRGPISRQKKTFREVCFSLRSMRLSLVTENKSLFR